MSMYQDLKKWYDNMLVEQNNLKNDFWKLYELINTPKEKLKKINQYWTTKKNK